MADPVRTCRGCRNKLPKAQLTRWVRGETGLLPDPAQRLPGRGIYTCSENCTNRLSKMKHRG